MEQSARVSSIFLVLFVSACTSGQTIPIENRFSLSDPTKSKDEHQKGLNWQLVVNECKSKAMTASAALEKSMASEHHGLENLQRARDKASELYDATFTACMNNHGYVKD